MEKSPVSDQGETDDSPSPAPKAVSRSVKAIAAIAPPAMARNHAGMLEPHITGVTSAELMELRQLRVALAEKQAQLAAALERALPYQLNATTQYEISPDGVHCVIDVPISGSLRPGEV